MKIKFKAGDRVKLKFLDRTDIDSSFSKYYDLLNKKGTIIKYKNGEIDNIPRIYFDNGESDFFFQNQLVKLKKKTRK